MTDLRLARRRLTIGFAALRLEWLGLALMLCAAVAGVLLSKGLLPAPARARPPSATVQLPPARQAALVQATLGEGAGEVRAVGLDAQLINAALPFNGGPIKAAASFSASGSELERSRALLCLTQAVYYEAGFEPLAGRRAVAQVVLNRLRHPAFPKSVCGVVYQRNATPVCQFSFVCDGSLLRAPAAAAWREAREIAEAALAGHVEPSVGSATHYHADYVAPRWAPLLAKISKLGTHIFYRWPGAWGMPAAFTGRYIGEPHDPAALRPVLRAVLRPDGTPLGVETPADLYSGPPIARAPNDVGGLLDTSKGWTLNIPRPGEIEGSTATTLAQQQAAPAAPAAPAPAAAAASPAPAAAAAAASVSAGTPMLAAN